MLKILGGQFRSRKLKTPRGQDVTRPWTGRSRESLFNQLRGHIQDGNILDLFAGVGTMGLEAVSRGANHAVLVEQDYKIFKTLEQNIELLGCNEIAHPIHCDALSTIPLLRSQTPINVAFIDPPYAMMNAESTRLRIFEQMERLSPILDEDGFIVLRSPMDPNKISHIVNSLLGPEIHKEGSGMWVLFYGKT